MINTRPVTADVDALRCTIAGHRRRIERYDVPAALASVRRRLPCSYRGDANSCERLSAVGRVEHAAARGPNVDDTFIGRIDGQKTRMMELPGHFGFAMMRGKQFRVQVAPG